MKIDYVASNPAATSNHQKSSTARNVDGVAPFASIMAEKLQEVSGNSVAASTSREAKYDFTHMTPQVLQETVGNLIKSGQMDLDESSSLLGMMPPTALSKVNYDGTAPAYSNAPVNFFAKIQSAIDATLSRNEYDSAAGLKKAADALARFQGQSVNLRA